MSPRGQGWSRDNVVNCNHGALEGCPDCRGRCLGAPATPSPAIGTACPQKCCWRRDLEAISFFLTGRVSQSGWLLTFFLCVLFYASSRVVSCTSPVTDENMPSNSFSYSLWESSAGRLAFGWNSHTVKRCPQTNISVRLSNRALGLASILVPSFWFQRDILCSVWEAEPCHGLQGSKSMASELSVDIMGTLYCRVCNNCVF